MSDGPEGGMSMLGHACAFPVQIQPTFNSKGLVVWVKSEEGKGSSLRREGG